MFYIIICVTLLIGILFGLYLTLHVNKKIEQEESRQSTQTNNRF